MHQPVMHNALLAALLERLPRRLLFRPRLFSQVLRLQSWPYLFPRPLLCVTPLLLLRDRALARAFPRACVGASPLAARRQVAAVPEPAIAADLHQPLDVHRDFLAEVALDATHFFDHAADLPHVVLGEVLDADVGAHTRLAEDVAGPLAADAVDVGESNLDPLRARKIDACDTRHVLSLLCLCLAFVQMTRTTPRRRTTLHLSQIRFTDALTFIDVYAFPTMLSRRLRSGQFGRVCRPLPSIPRSPDPDEQPDEVPLHPAGRMWPSPDARLDLHLVEARSAAAP